MRFLSCCTINLEDTLEQVLKQLPAGRAEAGTKPMGGARERKNATNQARKAVRIWVIEIVYTTDLTRRRLSASY